MNFLEELEWIYALYTLLAVAALWIAFAEHPNAQRLRAALLGTLGLS